MYVATRDIRGGDVVALCAEPRSNSGTEAAARAGHDSARHDITGHQVAAVTPLPSTTMPASLTV